MVLKLGVVARWQVKLFYYIISISQGLKKKQTFFLAMILILTLLSAFTCYLKEGVIIS